MNEEQYKQICDACDQALLASDSQIERTAIPWLHVLREHPAVLKEYESLFTTTGFFNELRAGILRSLHIRAGWVRQFWVALRSDGRAWFGPQTFSESLDVLIVSHLISESDFGKQSDFYFGSLRERLSAQGYRVGVALIDHRQSERTKGEEVDRKNGHSVIVFSRSLGLRDEFLMYSNLKKEASRLAAQSRRMASELRKRVLKRAAMETLSGSARATFRMFWQIRKLVELSKPKMLLVTYEGHAWERMAFAAAREAFPSVQCIAYQHAAIFRMQHGVRRKLQARFNPDRILTAGFVGKNQLDDAPGLTGIPVGVLGSPRASQLPPLDTATPLKARPKGQKGGACLVLPEGIPSECHRLFEFAANCAKLMPQMLFIWRLHPLVSFESLEIGGANFAELPENVELSRLTMEEDLARVDYALYRGSTAIVKAVSAGVKPVYLDQLGEMTIDPLYEMDFWREEVFHPAEFKLMVDRNQALPAEDEEQAAAMLYCDSFYSPLDPSVVVALLPNR